MTFVIPDRKAVAQLNYQLRRFENQCAELPEETRLRIQQEMQGLRRLLVDHEYEPADAREQDPDYVGRGCRGLSLDHRWQTSEFSNNRFCTKCGQPEDAPERC